MKVKYEFNLPEENDLYELYKLTEKMYTALSNIQDVLRGYEKYGNFTEEQMLQQIREEIFESGITEIS